MNILWLGPARDRIFEKLKAMGDDVRQTEERLTLDMAILEDKDFLVSYGYRHLVSAQILQRFSGRTANLHISYLPWNRGADPNLWSFLEGTPKGVTIHRMAERLDAGEIYIQKEMLFSDGATLRSAYQELSRCLEELFIETWPKIRAYEIQPVPQRGVGSYHAAKDRERFAHLLALGWDTLVRDIEGKGK